MTNKEAIEILKKLPNICGQGTAIQLAIKALEEIDKWKVAYDIACYACVKDTPYDSLACSECKHFNDGCYCPWNEERPCDDALKKYIKKCVDKGEGDINAINDEWRSGTDEN